MSFVVKVDRKYIDIWNYIKRSMIESLLPSCGWTKAKQRRAVDLSRWKATKNRDGNSRST